MLIMTTIPLVDNFTMQPPFSLDPQKNTFFSSSVSAYSRIYRDTQKKREPTGLFWKLPGYSLFQHSKSGKRIHTEHFVNG